MINCGDSSVGPYLKTEDGKKRKVYIIALIDDASRFIVGIDIFFNDNFINLMSVMKSAVAKYGHPQMFNFDNGKSYKNKQMELLAARIGLAQELGASPAFRKPDNFRIIQEEIASWLLKNGKPPLSSLMKPTTSTTPF